MTSALRVGFVIPDLVAIGFRKPMANNDVEDADGGDESSPHVANHGTEESTEGATVVSLQTRRPPPDLLPGFPNMTKYDCVHAR
ncbi:hypothetical protein [Streptomyces sp. WZ-12]|uniref:hypothetical protein n=1 Tax=Streptomyces sp. WZ-12 TaxID=3030210 RepID=UPI00238174B0|nr:hypothetical protein [Streptomyces sp. WZ-12]